MSPVTQLYGIFCLKMDQNTIKIFFGKFRIIAPPRENKEILCERGELFGKSGYIEKYFWGKKFQNIIFSKFLVQKYTLTFSTFFPKILLHDLKNSFAEKIWKKKIEKKYFGNIFFLVFASGVGVNNPANSGTFMCKKYKRGKRVLEIGQFLGKIEILLF